MLEEGHFGSIMGELMLILFAFWLVLTGVVEPIREKR